ncbi:hypothetical protein [Streptomyces sp. NBC_00344]|uniref:hypothetical protein n=1 Tax=Streptomyces sp. NBC_00344 TaxID=2975720 RepID=UPI002E21201D
MAISISLLVLLLVLAVIFLRGGGLKISHAIVCALLGFMLASTSVAPTIQQAVTGTARLVSTIQP